MESFEESPQGRLLTLGVALPLAAGACATVQGDGLGALVITAALFAGIALATFSVFTALDQRPSYAIAAILALPPLLLFYFPLLALADQLPIVRMAMGVVAAALIGFLARGVFPSARAHVAAPARRVVPHLT